MSGDIPIDFSDALADPPAESSRLRCRAVTKSGAACRNWPLRGSQYCRVHQAATPVETVAEEAATTDRLDRDDNLDVRPDLAESGRVSKVVAPSTPSPSVPRPAARESVADDDLLPIEDRLSAARQSDSADEGDLPGRLAGEMARFADAARRLLPAGLASAPLSAAEFVKLLRLLLGPLSPALQAGLRRSLESGYLNPDVWRGMSYVLTYLVRSQASDLRQRFRGDYQVDDYGLDEEFLALLLPVIQLFYQYYWRVDVTGVEHVPETGRALLVSNHSGVLPFDGVMIGVAVYNNTDAQRLVRSLVASWFPTLPFVSILLQRTGQVQASPHNALRLLQQDHLVAVFPEGYKGVGKLYRDRYQLARFGRGGFIRIAVRAGAPIIPVAVVGGEEIYPMIAKSTPLARLIGFPYFPITPTFPWTGPFGFIPLPSKWSIDFGEPIQMDAYGERAAANPALVNRLTEQVRDTIQQMLLDRLAKRRSIFLG